MPIPVTDFADRLLAWYKKARRDLPWRSDPSPYRVWISEVMLQQTQVKTALPYFERFLEAYPNIQSLASADEDELLSLWAGLGYYSRARNLLKAARVVVQCHGGVFPENWDQARQLPGVGRYTAGAVLSIGYGAAHPILDGNIRRLLARYLRWRPETDRDVEAFWGLLDSIVQDPAVRPEVAHFNQALMELGALVCTPRKPVCPECPLSTSCLARQSGVENEIVQARPSRAPERLEFVSAVIPREGEFLLRQNNEGPFLKGFWEFPWLAGAPRSGLASEFRAQHGLSLRILKVCRPVRHQITFRKLLFHPLICRLESEPEGRYVWTSIGRAGFPVSSYIVKMVQMVDG